MADFWTKDQTVAPPQDWWGADQDIGGGNPQDFARRAAGMTHAQIVDAYRAAKPGDPWGKFLAQEIQKPMAGETGEQAAVRSGGKLSPGPSRTVSGIMGAADTLSWGAGDEMAAALDAATSGRTYDQALWQQREAARIAQAENPKSYFGGQVAGAVAPAFLTGGSSSAGLGGKMLMSGGAGAVQGGAYGFGSGEGGLENRLENAGWGAALNGALGAGAPLIGKAVGAGWNAVSQALASRGLPAKAQGVILDMLQKSGLSPQQAASKLGELGPDGMIADLAQVEAAGTARASTDAGTMMAERLADRRAAGPGRVRTSLDAAFGPASDPYDVLTATQAAKAGIGPAYRTALSGAPQIAEGDAKQILASLGASAESLSKGNRDLAQSVRAQVADAFSAGSPELTASRLLDLRKSLDAQVVYGSRAQAMLSPADRATQGTIKQIRAEIDQVLKAHVPGIAEADAAHAPLSRQQSAYDFGRKELLKGGTGAVTPSELASRLHAMTPAEQDMVGQGTRAELERIVGNGLRDPGAAVDRATSRDWNTEKIARLLGEEKSSGLAKALDREATFSDTSNLIEPHRGSRTAIITEAAKDWATGSKAGVLSANQDTIRDMGSAFAGGSMMGGPAAGATAAGGVGLRRIVNALLNRGGGNEKLAGAVADMLTQTSGDRDRIVKALVGKASDRAARKESAAAAESLLDLLLRPMTRLAIPQQRQNAAP